MKNKSLTSGKASVFVAFLLGIGLTLFSGGIYISLMCSQIIFGIHVVGNKVICSSSAPENDFYSQDDTDMPDNVEIEINNFVNDIYSVSTQFDVNISVEEAIYDVVLISQETNNLIVELMIDENRLNTAEEQVYKPVGFFELVLESYMNTEMTQILKALQKDLEYANGSVEKGITEAEQRILSGLIEDRPIKHTEILETESVPESNPVIGVMLAGCLMLLSRLKD